MLMLAFLVDIQVPISAPQSAFPLSSLVMVLGIPGPGSNAKSQDQSVWAWKHLYFPLL